MLDTVDSAVRAEVVDEDDRVGSIAGIYHICNRMRFRNAKRIRSKICRCG